MKNPFAWIADLLARHEPPVADSVIPVGWTATVVPFPGLGRGVVWMAPRENLNFVCWPTTDAWRRLQPSHN